MAHRPFIYIAALRRTGSTVMAESLTRLPRLFVFREPRLGRGRFAVKPGDQERLAPYGVDLAALRRSWAARRVPSSVELFRRDLVEPLWRHVAQLGVKEIRHESWREYARVFPDLRVVLTGRDPRDIYISLYYRVHAGQSTWSGPYEPAAVAADLNREFLRQLEMHAELECLRVRYEDFCTDPQVLEHVRAFVGAEDLVGAGEIGGFNAASPNREAEFRLHGAAITDRRVDRWRREPDGTLRDAAQACFEALPEYRSFWGY